jgi:lipoprotein-releasing system permease protein
VNFPFFIAKRYFSTKKSSNFVHIISWVSLLGVTIGTAALILVLSVFNGFEDLILSMYNSFDPNLKITSAEGKVFNPDKVQSVLDNDAIEKSSFVLEEKVLLKYQEKEYIATVKGVDENYLTLTNFDSLLVDGEYLNKYENTNIAIVGRGVAYYLSMGVGNMFEQLQVYVPNRNSKTLLNPTTAFKQGSVLPIGIFGIQAEIDEKFIITPLAFIQNLADRENEISAVEIKLKNADEMLAVQKELQKELGDIFIVQNRLEQQEFLYKILNTEKLAVFLILAFIMIIATFNIIGALSMLMLDKKKDIQTFRSLGATRNEVQQIFFNKSVLTIIAGTVIGLSVGLGLAFLQQTFSFIGMGNGSFVVDSYPVAIKLNDVLLVSTTVILIGLLASWYPAKILTKKLF